MSTTTTMKVRPGPRVRPEPRPHRSGRPSIAAPSAQAPTVRVRSVSGTGPVARVGLVLRDIAAVLLLGDLAS